MRSNPCAGCWCCRRRTRRCRAPARSSRCADPGGARPRCSRGLWLSAPPPVLPPPRMPPPPAARLVDLVADLRLLAFGAQAGGIHRVDDDVGAVGGVDDAEEEPLHRGRQRRAPRKRAPGSCARAAAASARRSRTDRWWSNSPTRRAPCASKSRIMLACICASMASPVPVPTLPPPAPADASAAAALAPAAAAAVSSVVALSRASWLLKFAVARCAILSSAGLQHAHVAGERRDRRHRQVDAEDADVARRLRLRPEIALCRLYGEATRLPASGDRRPVP